MIKGIDISENNGFIPWNDVKRAGIDFVMVRSSYGRTGQDSAFAHNVACAHDMGLKVGAYHYSYALTPEQAIEEAKNCRDVIDQAGCLLEMPVFFDMEDADGYKARHGFDFGGQHVTACCKAFLDSIGLDAGVYASYSWLCNTIDWRSLKCAVWNAQWGKVDDFKGYMWQFTDSFYIGGKYFDGDIAYI